MDVNSIKEAVPNAQMAFFRNTNVHNAAPEGFGHVTIQEIDGILRLGIVVDDRDLNSTLLLLWKGDFRAMFVPFEGLNWDEIGQMWESARVQCQKGGWLVSKVFGQKTAIFNEQSQDRIEGQCTASPSGPDYAKLVALEEIVRLELDSIAFDAIYIRDNEPELPELKYILCSCC
jgi:hypothetical protein